MKTLKFISMSYEFKVTFRYNSGKIGDFNKELTRILKLAKLIVH